MADTLTGRCVGGPLDGQTITVRAADGFLAADKLNNRAWLYKRRADGSFAVCLDHDDALLLPDGLTTGERRLDWQRMPLTGDPLPVVSLGDSYEADAGDPVDDGWEV